MSDRKPDPTKNPEFQKVVQTFLHTKPKPRKTAKKKRSAPKKGRMKVESKSAY